jgi:hypothetical protein
MPDKITLKLKEPVLDYNEKPIHETARLQATAEQLAGKTQSEVVEMSPVLTTGELILRILSTSVKPLNVEENGDLYVFIKKVRNRMATGNGECQLDGDELKKLIGYMKRCEGPIANPLTLGYILDMLYTADEELKQQAKK